VFPKLIFTLTLFFVVHFLSEVGKTNDDAPQSPVIGQLVDAVRLRGTEDVFLQGDYAYLPCREGKRLTICLIKDPSRPQVVSSFTHSLLGTAAGFAINKNTIYLTSMSTQRLLVIDVTNKSTPRLLGSVKVGEKGVLYKAAYQDGYCYIPNLTEKKLFIVNVQNPQQPTVVGSVAVTPDNDGPFSVMLRGDYAFVGTIFGSRNRFAVVNVKDPAQPRLVTQVFGPDIGQVSGQAVGDLYYSVYWNNNAFLIFDISKPDQPRLQAKLVDKRLGKPNRCIVADNRAYLPMVEGNGVAVIDISDPMQPQFLTAYRDPVLLKKTYGVAVRGNLLFVASREGNSLVILDRKELENK